MSLFQLMTIITFDIGSPQSFGTFVKVDNKLPYAFVQIIFLQHGYCASVIVLFGPFTWLFINLTMCKRALFSKSATTLGLVKQHSGRCHLSQNGIGSNSFEVILVEPSRHSTTGTFFWDLGFSTDFSILLHERIRRRIRLCHFRTFIDIVTEITVVSSRRLLVRLPLPTISRFFCTRCFCPWILDLGVSFIISISGAKIPIS